MTRLGALVDLPDSAAADVEATGVAIDEFALNPRTQSLTFVSPVGRALYAVLTTPVGLFDFGVGTLVGVVCGSFASALFDAPRYARALETAWHGMWAEWCARQR